MKTKDYDSSKNFCFWGIRDHIYELTSSTQSCNITKSYKVLYKFDEGKSRNAILLLNIMQLHNNINIV